MSREHMLEELKQGSQTLSGDASDKVIIIRGCDPIMAERAGNFLPPMIGNAKLVSCTDDKTFFPLLQQTKYDVVMFAPGACRWSAAKKPIPGGNATSEGWGLEQYHELVREYQGADACIVGTANEKEVVPMLRKALALD